MYTIEQLGRAIKQKYPDYQKYPDAVVGQKILEKQPELKKLVQVSKTPPPQTAPQSDQSTQPTPPQEKKGVLGSAVDFVKGAVKDPIKQLVVMPGVRIGQAVSTGIGYATGNEKLKNISQEDYTANVPLLGDYQIKGLGSGSEGYKQVAGDALKSASYLATGKTVGGVVDKVVGGQAKGAILSGAATGAMGGALSSAGEELSNKDSNASSVASAAGKGGAIGAVAGGVIGGASSGVVKLARGFKSLFGRAPVGSIDDVVNQADAALNQAAKGNSTITPAKLRATTEQMTATPSLKEKWAGISADIKNRISGKQDKLKEYFDIAHARNNFDTAPTPLDYAAQNVTKVVDKMDEILNNTGSKIGMFRRKIGTYNASPDQISRIDSTFKSELSRLNLEIIDGVIKQKSGTVSRVASQGDIKALQVLHDNLQTVKEGPTLERIIDIRNLFDSEINFGKQAREVSNSVDPLARKIRKEIASVGSEIVGKSESLNLKKYSDFMDAYNELKSYTDRRAGSEFLLKQVLSERGKTPRELLAVIKETTGVDLMDDAVMSSIATDLIGNSRQKGLFRQEITKAGLDAQAVMSGDKGGAINLMYNLVKKTFLNEEKAFLKAAQPKNTSSKIDSLKRFIKDVAGQARTPGLSVSTIQERQILERQLISNRQAIAIAKAENPKGGIIKILEKNNIELQKRLRQLDRAKLFAAGISSIPLAAAGKKVSDAVTSTKESVAQSR